ncbi:MAG: glycine cleavage system aminomethyltransferase GcvT, partial [Phycisphaerae bacterium]|nr:glycine cleavage system aminomethyltransferase GcvT [Phycisphaerae bacterium]
MEGNKTVLYDRHVAAGAKIVDFAGWQMPIQYRGGIVQEHLRTRRASGLFD